MPNRLQLQPRRARSGTQSVERAFAVLKEVGAANTRGTTLSALVQNVRLNRTTLHRILKCLLQQGAIRHESQSKRFFLGPLTFELGIASRQQLDLHSFFSPALARIAETTGDTVFLMLRSGNDAVYIDRRMGSFPIKTLVVEIGTRRPLGIGAGSLTMLSALPEQEIQRVIRQNASRLPSYGETPEKLLKAVRIAQKAGYASRPVQGLNGVIALGLPILDPLGAPIAALSVAAIGNRMSKLRQRELVGILRSETARLQELLRDINVIDH